MSTETVAQVALRRRDRAALAGALDRAAEE